ncbi:MAG: cation diffusion facilitator family transporter [Rhodospirillaceae bacterium]
MSVGHDASHGHDHGHGHGHVHVPSGAGAGAERRILLALGLTASFMLVEVAGGLVAGSLALLADAGHMLTDVAALALAYAGTRLGRRPADPRRSYGWRRLEVLAAFVNGLTLIAVTGWIAVEAVQRILAPVPVLSTTMLAVAVLGLLVNVASFAVLRGEGGGNINVGGALAHVIGDMLGSLAAIAAALVIMATGWMPIDPILSLFVAALIVRSGWAILQRSAHILLEGTPEDVDVEAIKRGLIDVPGVADAHHVHVWSLTTGRPVATLHLRLQPGAAAAAVLPQVKAALRDRFGIDHSTVEVEAEACMDEIAPPHRHG